MKTKNRSGRTIDWHPNHATRKGPGRGISVNPNDVYRYNKAGTKFARAAENGVCTKRF